MGDSVFLDSNEILDATTSWNNVLEPMTCISQMLEFTSHSSKLELSLHIDNEMYIAASTCGDAQLHSVRRA
eukprot:11147253-Karenia_brevis.AAC.1